MLAQEPQDHPSFGVCNNPGVVEVDYVEWSTLAFSNSSYSSYLKLLALTIKMMRATTSKNFMMIKFNNFI